MWFFKTAHIVPSRVNENTKIHQCTFSGNWGQKENLTNFQKHNHNKEPRLRMDFDFSVAIPEARKQGRKTPSKLYVCLVAQSCLTLWDPVDCSLPGSSVQEDSPGTNIGMVAIPSSRGSSQPRNRTQVSHIAGRFFIIWATREALKSLKEYYFQLRILCQLNYHSTYTRSQKI